MLTDRSRTAIARNRFGPVRMGRAALACSSIAMAAALTSAPAEAQSFQGAGTVVSGSATIGTATNTTTISNISSDAVIDWTTFDTATGGGPINFQPAGTTATFSSSADFSVLNRIIPTDPSRAVQFNGNVIAQIQGSPNVPGGSVYFYSPGGVIVGSTAVFNVGNLGLTSIAPEVVGGVFEQGTGTEFVRLNGAVTAGSTVAVQPGAQINAGGPGNQGYLALVAPVIDQRGTININGGAALVSADAATLTFNPTGLFDIQVTSGTSGTGSTLFNNGTITGPAFSGGIPHRIYMVAVPKNTAITLAIGQGSTLGFDVAGAADVVGNAVVLSAGRDIIGGNIEIPRSPGGGTGVADLNIANTEVTSSLRGSSTDETFFFSIGGGTASTASTVNLIADFRATYTADGVGSVTIGDNTVTLNASIIGNGVTAGQTDIFAINGGQLDITSGGAALFSRGIGNLGAAPGSVGGNATGGIALITAGSGGDVSITGPVTVNANGNGGSGTGAAAGGTGNGGRAQIFASDAGSSITINGTANVTANGIGGVGNGGAIGGTGTGGQAFINAQLAASDGISITGAATIAANGQGGNANGGPGGLGIGGNAVAAASVNNSVQFGSTLNVVGIGTGGLSSGGMAGVGTGGSARIALFDNGAMTIGGNTLVISNGFAGSGSFNPAITQGGTTNVDVQQNSTLDIVGDLLAASGGGGIGAPPTMGNSAGRGGSTTVLVAGGSSIDATNNILIRSLSDGAPGGGGTGGTATLQLNGGTLSGNSLQVATVATGGSIGVTGSGNAGVGTGGTSNIFVGTGTNTLTFNRIDVLADGVGGDNAGTAGNAGAGIGGVAQVSVNNGASLTVNAAETFLEADGEGGNSTSLNGDGGAGNGGRANLNVDGGSATFNSDIGLSGESEGGEGINGGAAFGDGESTTARALVFARNGSLTVNGSTTLVADADGGTGNLGGNGGNATGGFAQTVAANGVNTTGFGIISLAALDISSDADGGFAAGTGNGGSASAGRSHLFANGGTITVSGDALIQSGSFGGFGVNGGDAISARPFRQPRALIGTSHGSVTIAGTTRLFAEAFGGGALSGSGGTGGIAFAGSAAIEAQSNNGPSTISLVDLELVADAFGGSGGSASPTGNGGAGGEAYGGFASALGNAGQGTLIVTGATVLDATAIGGTGGAGHAGTTNGTDGGVGGRAIGGGINVGTASGADTPSNTGSATFGSVQGLATANGGSGGDGGSGTTPGAAGSGGVGFGGTAVLLVRGSQATFTDVTFDASGIGGDAGGGGGTSGTGGEGYGGDTALIVTQRFNRTERGLLIADNISFGADAIGGLNQIGQQANAFYSASQGAEGDVFIRQSDVTIGNFNLSYGGQLAPNVTATILSIPDDMTSFPVPTSVTVTSEPFDINVMDSTVDVAGTFSIGIPGVMRVALDTSTFNVDTLTLIANNYVLPAIVPVSAGTFNVSGGLGLFSAVDFLTYANFNVPFDTSFGWAGDFQVGNFTSGGDFEVDAAGSITTGAVDVDGTIDLVAGGALTTGTLAASDSVFGDAGGVLNVGAVSAGIVDPLTPPIDGYTIGLRGGTSLTAGNLSALGNIGLSSPGSISIGSAFANSIILALPGTGFASGALSTTATSGGRIYIANNSMETLGGMVGPGFNPAPILAASQVQVNGPIAINGPVSTGILQANALSTIGVTGPIAARQSSVLVGGTSITTGDVTVGSQAIFASAGPIVIGNVDAGLAIPTTTGKIAIGSNNGPVTTGNLAANTDLGIQTGGAIMTGNLRGRDVLLLANGAVTTGAITAIPGSQQQIPGNPQQFTQAGRVYFGNFSQATPQANAFAPFFGPTGGTLSIFDATPVATTGSIAINGPVQARIMRAGTTMNFTAGAITLASSQSFFNDLQISAGGLITANGAWRSDFIFLESNDIDITTTGTLTGFVELISTNQTMAVIGDISSSGATQPGSGAYRLTDAEFDRISGGFGFGARDNTGEVDLLVGDLSVDASRFDADSEGGEIFVYSDDDSSNEDFAGRIRVDGNVTVTNAPGSTSDGEAFRIEFDAKSFELNAATGSVTIAGANGVLAGAIEIEGENIHVASDEILLKLRADPRYEGSVQELNAPAAVQRPDGVLRANILQLEGEDTILIQNTGSAAVPAGFVTRIGNETEDDDGTSIGPEDDDDRSSTDTFRIVINGQLQTDSGLVTGKAAFDQIVTAARSDLDPGEEFGVGLDPESTLNSCNIISGACAFGSSDPVASISSEVKLAIINQLGDAPVPDVIEEAADSATESADEEAAQSSEEEDEAEADEASSPIAPPTPLINTRPLNPAVSVVEPVAGAGNPALIGSAVNEATAQGDTP